MTRHTGAGRAVIVPSGRAHFKCSGCGDDIWREGGHAFAQKHQAEVHGTHSEYAISIRTPQAYNHRQRVFNNTGFDRRLSESGTDDTSVS